MWARGSPSAGAVGGQPQRGGGIPQALVVGDLGGQLGAEYRAGGGQVYGVQRPQGGVGLGGRGGADDIVDLIAGHRATMAGTSGSSAGRCRAKRATRPIARCRNWCGRRELWAGTTVRATSDADPARSRVGADGESG